MYLDIWMCIHVYIHVFSYAYIRRCVGLFIWCFCEDPRAIHEIPRLELFLKPWELFTNSSELFPNTSELFLKKNNLFTKDSRLLLKGPKLLRKDTGISTKDRTIHKRHRTFHKKRRTIHTNNRPSSSNKSYKATSHIGPDQPDIIHKGADDCSSKEKLWWFSMATC